LCGIGINDKLSFPTGKDLLMKKHHICRKFRTERNLTTKELAQSLNVFQEQLSRIENGHTKCGELMARRLGEYFGVDWRVFVNNMAQ